VIKSDLVEIKKYCIERSKTTPNRGESYHVMMKRIREFCNKLREISKERQKIDIKDTKIEYVFISGQMKSGTSLMQGILDNHSKIFCFPGDTRLMKKGSLGKDSLFFWITRFITPTGLEPFCMFEKSPDIYIDIAKIVIDNENKDVVDQFKILSKYFCEKLKKSIVIEKTPENEYSFADISKRFKSFKMIHVYRNPIETLISQKRLSGKRGDVFNINFRLSEYFKSLSTVKNLRNRENFVDIEYKSLLEGDISNILDFLDVEREETLKISTCLGIPLSKNTMSKNKGIDGVIKKSEDNLHKSVIDTFSHNEIVFLIDRIQKEKEILSRYGFDIRKLTSSLFNFNVIHEEETLEHVLKNKLSVARMGDGELLEIIAFKNDINHPVSKQSFSEELRSKMIEVLFNKDVFLCIVPYFSEEQIKRASVKSKGVIGILETMRKVWISLMSQNLELQRHMYGSTWFNRNDNNLNNKNFEYFSRFKDLYKNKNVILVTGSKVKSIESFKMFEKAATKERVDIPEFDAFSDYNRIFEDCKKKASFYDKDNVVFHISAGATGTILSSDLTKLGYQSLDLGSIFNKIEAV
jgi:hypothetical protein